MRIVSTTLAGPGTETIIGDALRSVAPIVDSSLIVWTGIRRDDPHSDAAIFCEAAEAGPFEWAEWPWQDDFGKARQAAIDLAQGGVSRDAGWSLGHGDWMLMLDTDERVRCPDPAALRAYLASLAPTIKIVCVHTAEGTYSRERFFRGDIKERWYLRTHETIDVLPHERATAPRDLIAWTELPKSEETIRVKCERDLAMLRADLVDHPGNGRILFYLGQSLEFLGRHEEALPYYRKVSEMGFGEGPAWACFCAARNHLRTEPKKIEEAYAACIAAVFREPRMAEPYWLAASICQDMGRPELAIAWAKMAEVHGEGSESHAQVGGFRVPMALDGGPARVIEMARESIAKSAAPAVRRRGPSDREPTAEELRQGHKPWMFALWYDAMDSLHAPKPVHITVTGTGFHAGGWAARCIESVRAQTREAAHVYIAADDDTYKIARAYKPDTRDGRNASAFENLIPLWRSLPPEEVVVWLDGDDCLATPEALEIVAKAHEAGAWVTYGEFKWSSTGEVGFAAQHDHSLGRRAPWRATILRTFRAGLIRRIREADLRWPDGRYLDATLDQAIMLPCLEMAGPERSRFIHDVLAVYNDVNFRTMSQGALAHEARALKYIRTRREYERLVTL